MSENKSEHKEDDTIRCPKCGGSDVRKSLTRNMVDLGLGIFGFTALRCRGCRHRFYRRLWEEEEGGEDEKRQ